MDFLLQAPEDAGWLEQLGHLVAEWMNIFGGPGIAAAIAVENLFPPIPSEVVLPFAGFTAAQPGATFTWWSAIIWATLGSVIGAVGLYWIGRLLGLRRMVAIAEVLPLVDANDVHRAVDWFDRHGSKAVFFGRMLPIFRSLISIPAGIAKMPQLRFLLFTTAGSAIWNSIFIIGGYLLGDQWETILEYSSVFEKIALVVIAAVFVWWLVVRIRHRTRARRDLSGEGDGSQP